MADISKVSNDFIKVQELMRSARAEDAALLCKEICERESGNINAWLMQGQVLGQLGRYIEAVDSLRAAVDIQPDNAVAHYLLGAVFQALNDDSHAIDCYQRAISIESDYVDALNNLGVILQKSGDFQVAANNYEKVINLSPAHVGAIYNMGLVKLSMGQEGEAVEYFRKSLSLNPDSAPSHYNLGKIYCKKEVIQEAKEHFSAAIQLAPRWPEARVELGNLLSDVGEYKAALQHYAAALEDRPESASIHYNFAHALQALLRFPEAVEHYSLALRYHPVLLEAYNNLGLVHQDMGCHDEAMKVFDKALSVAESPPHASTESSAGDRMPSDVEIEIRWHRSLLLLLMGNYSQGWQEYEWRWMLKATRKRALTQTLWDGSDIAEKSILIYGEQGIGDEILFASCFHDVISRAGSVVIDCDKRLVPLFQRSFPKAVVHGGPQDEDISWLGQVGAPGIRIPSGSLPRILRKHRADYYPHRRYLVCDPDLEMRWRSRFSGLSARFVVGIAWKSGNASKSRLRSTHLLQWQPLLSIADVAFVNLQYGDCKGELEDLREQTGLTVHDWPDANPLLDLDNFAAQISALNLVISIDNSTVHMSGALAVPTWIAQPYSPEWRWGISKEDSYWYPNIRQFHQQAIGDWDSVFRDLAAALEEYIDASS